MRGYEVEENEEENEETIEENEEVEDATHVTEVVEVDPDTESVYSFHKNDWEEFHSDSEDSLIISFQCVQSKNAMYEHTNILLDTGSTCSVIRNHKMLLNITKSRRRFTPLRMESIRI